MSALVRVQRHGISMCYWRKLTIALSEGRLYQYLKCIVYYDLGFSGGSDRKESTCKRRGFDPWVGKVKEKGTATHSGILA